MLLKSFRVTEFRSVQDSGWIDAEQITALIGTNESGKTTVVKREILKGTDKVISEKDPQYSKIAELFRLL